MNILEQAMKAFVLVLALAMSCGCSNQKSGTDKLPLSMWAQLGVGDTVKITVVNPQVTKINDQELE